MEYFHIFIGVYFPITMYAHASEPVLEEREVIVILSFVAASKSRSNLKVHFPVSLPWSNTKTVKTLNQVK